MLDLDVGKRAKLCNDSQVYFGRDNNVDERLDISLSPVSANKNCTKSKASRRKLFNDEENLSPVLGLRILPAETPNPVSYPGPALNRMDRVNTLSTQKNVKKASQFGCKLCQKSFEDPLQLANHRCIRIENVQYVCPECGKIFNCPANLASHRRWHKPKKNLNNTTTEFNDKPKTDTSVSRNRTDSVVNQNKKTIVESFNCHICGKGFSSPTILKEHAATTHNRSSIRSDDLISQNVYRPEKDYQDKPITTRRDALHSTGDFYQETVFGGLAALAYAAEMHPVMFPFRMNKHDQKTDSKKRASTPVSNLLYKSAKLDTQVYSHAKETSVWLPPSPPRSDLSSCSPRSTISDDVEEKCKKATVMRVAAPTPPTDYVFNPHVNTNSEKHAIVRPMSTTSIAFNEKAYFTFPQISFNQTHSRAVTNLSSANIQTSNTFLNFHEPYHPYVFSSQQQSHYSTPSHQPHQQWNSWSTHPTTAWKTSTYY